MDVFKTLLHVQFENKEENTTKYYWNMLDKHSVILSGSCGCLSISLIFAMLRKYAFG